MLLGVGRWSLTLTRSWLLDGVVEDGYGRPDTPPRRAQPAQAAHTQVVTYYGPPQPGHSAFQRGGGPSRSLGGDCEELHTAWRWEPHNVLLSVIYHSSSSNMVCKKCEKVSSAIRCLQLTSENLDGRHGGSLQAGRRDSRHWREQAADCSCSRGTVRQTGPEQGQGQHVRQQVY